MFPHDHTSLLPKMLILITGFIMMCLAIWAYNSGQDEMVSGDKCDIQCQDYPAAWMRIEGTVECYCYEKGQWIPQGFGRDE